MVRGVPSPKQCTQPPVALGQRGDGTRVGRKATPRFPAGCGTKRIANVHEHVGGGTTAPLCFAPGRHAVNRPAAYHSQAHLRQPSTWPSSCPSLCPLPCHPLTRACPTPSPFRSPPVCQPLPSSLPLTLATHQHRVCPPAPATLLPSPHLLLPLQLQLLSGGAARLQPAGWNEVFIPSLKGNGGGARGSVEGGNSARGRAGRLQPGGPGVSIPSWPLPALPTSSRCKPQRGPSSPAAHLRTRSFTGCCPRAALSAASASTSCSRCAARASCVCWGRRGKGEGGMGYAARRGALKRVSAAGSKNSDLTTS